MIEKHLSALTNKTYTLTTTIEAHINPDTDLSISWLSDIIGKVNGISVLRVTRSNTDSLALDYYHYDMLQSLESFVNGSHHITHYSSFPEIQSALISKIA
jgi:hypothetical protein